MSVIPLLSHASAMSPLPRSAPRFSYRIHGLVLDSEIPLPGYPPHAGTPDVTFRFGRLPSHPIPPPGRICVWTHAQEAWINFGIGRVRIRDGRDIVLDPTPQATETVIGLSLTSGMMLALLRQRGCLPLHASGIAIQGGACLFLGASRAGKSSTVAALQARGHAVLSDDLSAVRFPASGPPELLPAACPIRLFDNTLQVLGKDPGSFPFPFPEATKRPIPPSGALLPAFPIRCLYLLGRGEALRVEPVEPRIAFYALLRNSMGLVARPPVLAMQDIERVTAFLNRVPVLRLISPSSPDLLPEIAAFVERDASQRPLPRATPDA